MRMELVLEKCRHPKKAPRASGDGWAASSTWCRDGSMSAALLRAKLPQRRNTMPLQFAFR